MGKHKRRPEWEYVEEPSEGQNLLGGVWRELRQKASRDLDHVRHRTEVCNCNQCQGGEEDAIDKFNFLNFLGRWRK